MDEARLFFLVHSDGTRSNGLKHEHKKFYNNMWENFFIVRVLGCWNRLSRVVVEMFKIRLNAYLCSLLLGACFGRRVGLHDLWRSLPDSTIL